MRPVHDRGLWSSFNISDARGGEGLPRRRMDLTGMLNDESPDRARPAIDYDAMTAYIAEDLAKYDAWRAAGGESQPFVFEDVGLSDFPSPPPAPASSRVILPPVSSFRTRRSPSFELIDPRPVGPTPVHPASRAPSPHPVPAVRGRPVAQNRTHARSTSTTSRKGTSAVQRPRKSPSPSGAPSSDSVEEDEKPKHSAYVEVVTPAHSIEEKNGKKKKKVQVKESGRRSLLFDIERGSSATDLRDALADAADINPEDFPLKRVSWRFMTETSRKDQPLGNQRGLDNLWEQIAIKKNLSRSILFSFKLDPPTSKGKKDKKVRIYTRLHCTGLTLLQKKRAKASKRSEEVTPSPFEEKAAADESSSSSDSDDGMSEEEPDSVGAPFAPQYCR